MWPKEKLLIMSNFSFGNNVFKSHLLLLRLNASTDWKGLKLSASDLLYVGKHQCRNVKQTHLQIWVDYPCKYTFVRFIFYWFKHPTPWTVVTSANIESTDKIKHYRPEPYPLKTLGQKELFFHYDKLFNLPQSFQVICYRSIQQLCYYQQIFSIYYRPGCFWSHLLQMCSMKERVNPFPHTTTSISHVFKCVSKKCCHFLTS